MKPFETQKANLTEATPDPKPIRVLIVDDEPAHAEAICRALQNGVGRWDTQVAGSLEEFQAAARAFLPDLAILDWLLPDGQAESVLTSPPEEASFPVIVMTSHGDEAVAVGALQAGAIDYVVKSPDAFAAMPHTIGRALRSWRALRERREAVAAVQDSERRFRSLFDHMTELVALHELVRDASGRAVDYRFLDVNPAFCRVTGTARERVVGALASEVYGAAPPPLLEVYARVVESGSTTQFEFHFPPLGKHFLISAFSPAPGQFGTVAADITERKAAEDALHESQERYRLLVEESPDLIGVYQDGRLVFLNSVGARLLGVKQASELLGMEIREMIHPEDRVDAAQRMSAKGGVYPAEVRYLRVNGTVLPVEVSASPITFAGRAATQFIARDITERKETEARVRLQDTRLRLAMEAAGMFTWSLDITTGRLEYSDNLAAMAEGRDLKPYHQLATLLERIHPEDSARLRKALQRTIQAGAPYECEYRVRLGDSGWRWVLTLGRRVEGEDGLGAKVVGVSVDVSARKHAEAHMRQWADAFEHCAHGVAMSLPGSNDVLACNPALARMLGRNAEEIVGSKILSLYAPEDHQQVKDWIAEADLVGQVRYETCMIRADGSRVPVQMDVVSVAGPDGKPAYRVATAEDITERKRAEEETRQRLELQDQVARIAHSVPGMIYSLKMTVEGKFCMPFATSALQDLWGVTPEAVRDDAACLFERIHPEDVESLRQSVLHSAQTLEPWHGALRVLHPQKGELWMEAHSVPRREPDGSVVWHGFAQDATERKQVEQALQDSERRFATVFKASPAAIALSRLQDGVFLDVNDAFVRLYGYARNEVLGQTSTQLQLWPSTDRLALVTELQRRKRIHDLEVPALCKCGQRRQVLASLELIEVGGEVLVLGIAVDITERKRAEELLRIQHNLAVELGNSRSLQEGLRLCLDAALEATGLDSGGFYLQDEAGNLELLAHRGLSPKFIANVTHFQVASPQARLVTPGRPVYMRFADLGLPLGPAERAEGLRVCAVVPLCRDGQVIGSLNAASHVANDIPAFARRALETIAAEATHDIARLKAEEALLDSEARFRQMAERIESVFWINDLDLARLTYVSPAYERIWGRTTASLYEDPSSFLKAVHPEDRQRVASALRAPVPKAQGSFETEYRVVRPDGSVRWVRDRGYPVRDADGTPVRVVGITDDITETKHAEQQLRERGEQLRALYQRLEQLREEERTRMAREVHDVLGQLLTAIKMDINWWERRFAQLPDAEMRRSFEARALETARLTDLTIETVQKISRELRPSVLDNIGLEAALQFEARQFRERTGMACRVSVPKQPLKLGQDLATGVFRVYQELLTNIARHAKATRVHVSLGRKGRQLTLRVSDNGCGIGESAVHSPEALGLQGMRERASLLGGTIRFQGRRGEGTTVQLTVPLSLA